MTRSDKAREVYEALIAYTAGCMRCNNDVRQVPHVKLGTSGSFYKVRCCGCGQEGVVSKEWLDDQDR